MSGPISMEDAVQHGEMEHPVCMRKYSLSTHSVLVHDHSNCRKNLDIGLSCTNL